MPVLMLTTVAAIATLLSTVHVLPFRTERLPSVTGPAADVKSEDGSLDGKPAEPSSESHSTA